MPQPVKLNQAAHMERDGQAWAIRLRTRPGVTTKQGTPRDAFYLWTGDGSGVVQYRHGRRGTQGQGGTIGFNQLARKVSQKLAGDYMYDDGTSQAVPVVQQPPAQRVRTMRERLGRCTMRPTTMDSVWGRIAAEGWVRLTPDADYTDLYRGCRGLVLYQSKRGALWVVVRYPGDELVMGKLQAV